MYEYYGLSIVRYNKGILHVQPHIYTPVKKDIVKVQYIADF